MIRHAILVVILIMLLTSHAMGQVEGQGLAVAARGVDLISAGAMNKGALRIAQKAILRSDAVAILQHFFRSKLVVTA